MCRSDSAQATITKRRTLSKTGGLEQKGTSSHGLSSAGEHPWGLSVCPHFLFVPGHQSEETRGPHLTFLTPFHGPVSKVSHVLWY